MNQSSKVSRDSIIPIITRFPDENTVIEKWVEQLVDKIPPKTKLQESTSGFKMAFHFVDCVGGSPYVEKTKMFEYAITESEIRRTCYWGSLELVDERSKEIIVSMPVTEEDSISISPEEFELIKTIRNQHPTLKLLHVYGLHGFVADDKIMEEKLESLWNHPKVLETMGNTSFMFRKNVVFIGTAYTQEVSFNLYFYQEGCEEGTRQIVIKEMQDHFDHEWLARCEADLNKRVREHIMGFDVESALEEVIFQSIRANQDQPSTFDLRFYFSPYSTNKTGFKVINGKLYINYQPMYFYCEQTNIFEKIGESDLGQVCLGDISPTASQYSYTAIDAIDNAQYLYYIYESDDVDHNDRILKCLENKVIEAGLIIRENNWGNYDDKNDMISYTFKVNNPAYKGDR